jgi:hypothetical protein
MTPRHNARMATRFIVAAEKSTDGKIHRLIFLKSIFGSELHTVALGSLLSSRKGRVQSFQKGYYLLNSRGNMEQ